MNKLNVGRDLYLKGRIGWQGLSKDEYLPHSNYKIINATALKDGYVDFENCGYITKERYEEAKEIQLKENDILISKDGTLGKIGYVKNLSTPCSVASGIFVLRNLKPDLVDFDYLYHILKSNIFKDFINRNKAQGSTISHLYQRDLNNFEIELPSLEEQRRITKILNTIDLKISNNIKIISDLESMVKLLYDYWFVQFDFPDENGKPYKSSGGKMVWNDELKREIPEGWSSKLLYEIESNIVTGKTPPTKDKSNFGKDVPFITIGDIRGNMYVVNTTTSLSYKGAETQKNKYLPENAICVTCIATPGLVGFTTKKCQTNQQINSIICKRKYNENFLYFAIKHYFNYSTGAKTGNTFKNMNKEDFSNIRLVYSKKIVQMFFNKTENIFNRILEYSRENQELASLRDFLLPMLMNGQVKIKEKGK